MRQDVKILQLFRGWLRPPSSGCCWWLDALLSSVCPSIQLGFRVECEPIQLVDTVKRSLNLA